MAPRWWYGALIEFLTQTTLQDEDCCFQLLKLRCFTNIYWGSLPNVVHPTPGSSEVLDLTPSSALFQYYADATEAESWMREKQPLVCSEDYGKDENSAQVRC